MKKNWGEPIVQVQLFVPQECVAACSRITNIYLDLNYNDEYDYRWGEEVSDQLGWLYSQQGEKRQFKEVKAYSGHHWLSGSYISNPNYYDRTYPVVEIRRGGSWPLYDYYAYNATS